MAKRWLGQALVLAAALAAGCSGGKGADGAPGIASAAAPLRLDVNGQLSVDTASATGAGALSASDWTSFNAKVGASDPRLSDARAPLPGSAHYIQNGDVPQAGAISVSGAVVAGSFALIAPATRVLAIPPSAFLPAVSTTTYDGQLAGGARWISGGTWPAWLLAPVHLPDGAIVESIRCNVISSSATQTVSVVFSTLAGDGGFPVGAGVETELVNAGPGVQTLTMSLGWPVNNGAELYQLGFLPSFSMDTCGSACQILGCWITHRQATLP